MNCIPDDNSKVDEKILFLFAYLCLLRSVLYGTMNILSIIVQYNAY